MASSEVLEALSPEAAAIERSRGRLDGHWINRTLNSRLFGGHRLANCGAPRSSEVKAGRRADGRAQVAEIATCASPWACARCASVIRAARAQEIEHYAASHITAGHCLLFLTLTLPHLRADKLAGLLAGLQDAWGAMTKGRPWRTLAERFSIIGQIKAVEVTIGLNGWHPHLHVLLFLDTPPLDPDGDDVAELRARVTELWGHMVARHLDGRQINQAHAVDLVVVNGSVQATQETIARYLSKIHFEMTRADLKTRDTNGPRTPWQVAVDAWRWGDAADVARWTEYVTATRGRRVFSVSTRLRDRYHTPDIAERTDDELAAEDQGDLTVEVAIANNVWGHARHARTTNDRSVIAAALLAYEDHTIAAMARTLADHLDRPVVVVDRPGDVPLIRYHQPSDPPPQPRTVVY